MTVQGEQLPAPALVGADTMSRRSNSAVVTIHVPGEPARDASGSAKTTRTPFAGGPGLTGSEVVASGECRSVALTSITQVKEAT